MKVGELRIGFICYRSDKNINLHYSEEVYRYIRKKYPQVSSKKFIMKLLTRCVIRVHEYNSETDKLLEIICFGWN
jgi:hypothetical protein